MARQASGSWEGPLPYATWLLSASRTDPCTTVIPAANVRLLVRGPNGFPKEIGHMHTGLHEVED
jgi:hypothetical protein